jgi:hypothetical protein
VCLVDDYGAELVKLSVSEPVEKAPVAYIDQTAIGIEGMLFTYAVSNLRSDAEIAHPRQLFYGLFTFISFSILKQARNPGICKTRNESGDIDGGASARLCYDDLTAISQVPSFGVRRVE